MNVFGLPFFYTFLKLSYNSDQNAVFGWILSDVAVNQSD